MKKRLFSIVAVVALVSFTALAFAAPRGAGKAAGDGYGALSPEKRAAVQKIFESHQDKLYELREKIWAKHTELQALSQSGKADKADIQAIIADISKLRDAMHQERLAIRNEIEKETGIKGFGYHRGFHRGGYGMMGGEGSCSGGGFGGKGGGFGPGACPGGGACGN